MSNYIVLVTATEPNGTLKTFIPSNGDGTIRETAIFRARSWASHANAPTVKRVLVVDTDTLTVTNIPLEN